MRERTDVQGLGYHSAVIVVLSLCASVEALSFAGLDIDTSAVAFSAFWSKSGRSLDLRGGPRSRVSRYLALLGALGLPWAPLIRNFWIIWCHLWEHRSV